MNVLQTVVHTTMRLAVSVLRDVLILGFLCTVLVTADEDSDFEDDVTTEEFDDVSPSHSHDHDDDTVESVKPLERVRIVWHYNMQKFLYTWFDTAHQNG